MKFKLGDRTYDVATTDALTLKMALELEKETTDFGHTIRFGDIEAMTEELDACKTEDERRKHPLTMWVLAVTIWSARRLAGDTVTFDQAVDIPFNQITFLPDPSDHPRPANPTKGRPRKGSGPAAKRAASRVPAKTSGRPSTPV